MFLFFSGQEESLSSAKPDNISTTRMNKINKTPDTSVIIKEHIGDTFNPRKIPK